MQNFLKARWNDLSQGLWFLPGIVAACFGALGYVLIRVDTWVNLGKSEWVFQGDDNAARTVLSVIAGSLITVAGLTFSITIVALQLASSQFSPRVLRNFFADRVTQFTAGAFVGMFVYAMIVLREVGSIGLEAGFVPRLAITVGTALAVGAVGLLLYFIHHVSQLIQVSHTIDRIYRQASSQLERLYPEAFGASEDEDGRALVEEWRRGGGFAPVSATRPGYVKRVGLDDLVADFDEPPDRIVVLVRPGDFVPADRPIAEVWPAEQAERCAGALRRAVDVGSERDFVDDADFGVRSLTDIALKAISPSVNDPTTAETAIGYLRSILWTLASRRFPGEVRRFDGVTIVARRREFTNYLDAFLEIGRYADGDARIATALLDALAAIAGAAVAADAPDRAWDARRVADVVAAQAVEEARNDADREAIESSRERVAAAAAGA